MNDFDKFKALLEKSNTIVGFSGAGISTDSGIPDYRSQGGLWEKFQPVYLDEFINDESKRLLYWQRKQALWQGIKDAIPGKTHLFFKKLYDQEKLVGMITQNIDGLHEKSGLPCDVLVNLHGTNLEIICLSCGDITPAHETFDDLDLKNGPPLCKKCGGLLKPNTVSFGQSLVQDDLKRAEKLSLSCDLMIAVGSTLVVQPAASFPVIAQKNGAALAIITKSDTPLDGEADFVFHEPLGEFIDRLTSV